MDFVLRVGKIDKTGKPRRVGMKLDSQYDFFINFYTSLVALGRAPVGEMYNERSHREIPFPLIF